MMRVSVNPSRCEGHGHCYTICPEVFIADAEGFASAASELVEADDKLEATVRRALLSCPEQAITVRRSRKE